MVDACVDNAVVIALEQDGYDVVVSPLRGKPKSLDDPEIIALSAHQGRILITDDLHIGEFFDSFVNDGGQHPGMILLVQTWGTSQQIALLRHTLRTWDSANLTNVRIFANRSS